jgi:hypothetical protein
MPTDLFARCHDHQAHALAGISLTKSLIETSFDAYDEVAMATARGELSEALASYQQLKHEGIFDPAIVSGDAARADRARTMKVACIAAGEEYRQFVNHWTVVSGHDRWPEYRLSTLNLIKRLRDHIDTERRALDDLATMYPTR